MFVDPDYKTKEELAEAVKHGAVVVVYEPQVNATPRDGVYAVKGPWLESPKWSTWTGKVMVRNGFVREVL